MERVTLVQGDSPVLIVAPHGVDDKNTDLIAEKVAVEIGAYAVINKGWKRSQQVDYFKDFANCNNLQHLHSDVVREEFLEPIIVFKNRIKKLYDDNVSIIILHGCSNEVRNKAQDQSLDLILGWGLGSPFRSCSTRFKNSLCYHLMNEGFGVYEGSHKSKYSGSSKNNLNQLFKRWYPDDMVNSIQIEIVKELRCDPDFIDLTINSLANALSYVEVFDDTFPKMQVGCL